MTSIHISGSSNLHKDFDARFFINAAKYIQNAKENIFFGRSKFHLNQV